MQSRGVFRWMWRRIPVLVAIGVLESEPALAQASRSEPPRMSRFWTFADAAGYGSLGTGVGLLTGLAVGGSCGYGPCVTALLGAASGAVIGVTGGIHLAQNARRRLESGKALETTQMTAVRAGAVLAGSVAGLTASFLLINPKGSGTPLGDDDVTFGLLTGGGMALGAVLGARHKGELSPQRIAITPGLHGSRGASLQVAISF